MSALERFADSSQTLRQVRKVPIAVIRLETQSSTKRTFPLTGCAGGQDNAVSVVLHSRFTSASSVSMRLSRAVTRTAGIDIDAARGPECAPDEATHDQST